MIVWVAAWMRVVLKVVSLAAVLSHQVTLLSNIGVAIREFPHKNSQKHSVNLAENLELVLGRDHVIHIEK